jgi:NAD(P)-dependent dehydrogenase (short-subunit alcohol dehydrogenase family)
MTNELEGRTALVTGGSRGIGLAIAHRFANAGARVVISSRREDNLAEAVATFVDPSRVHSVAAHVGSRAEAERLVGATIAQFGSLDVLVNNAATNPHFGPLVDISDSQMQKTYEVNQASILTHSASAWQLWMREHGGVILNIASIGGLGPEPGLGWYNVTKAAVIHLTKQLAWELSPLVRVNAIAPGLIRTELARGLWEEHETAIASRIPLGRLGEPADIAEMALMLSSDASSWMTGQVLVIDGGTTNQPSGGVG